MLLQSEVRECTYMENDVNLTIWVCGRKDLVLFDCDDNVQPNVVAQ